MSSHVLVPKGCWYVTPWRGQMVRYAAGGMMSPEWITKGGLDPADFAGISFAFGLERTAQARYDLDDIRKLWQPPHVPAGA